MIITSQGSSSKASLIGRLKYVKKDDAIVYTKNIISDPNDLEAIEQEYFDNFKYLDSARGKNLIFNQTLSMPVTHDISKDDQAKSLKIIVDKYLELRDMKEHLAYIAIHTDAEHVHAHIIASSNKLFGKKRHRESKADFLSHQQDIEKFRNKTFKHLPQTNHYSELLEKRISLAESRIKHMRGAITTKEKILSKVKYAIGKSDRADFVQYMKSQKLVIYKRGVKTVGVRDLSAKKNYRLETLEKGMRDKYLSYEKKVNLAVNKKVQQQVKDKKIAQDKAIQVKKSKGGRNGR
jgi:hypothetical protein